MSGCRKLNKARVTKELRSAGISLQSLRSVVKQLRKTDFSANLAEARLVVSGKGVYVKDDQCLISMLFDPGQTQLPFTVLHLGHTLKVIRSEADQMGSSSLRFGPMIARTAGARPPQRHSRQLSLGLSLGPAESEPAKTTEPTLHPRISACA